MSNGFSRMHIQPEMATGNGEIGGHGHLLAGAQAKKRAIVADPSLTPWLEPTCCPAANLLQKHKLARLPARQPIRPFRSLDAAILLHFFLSLLRIGQVAVPEAARNGILKQFDAGTGMGNQSLHFCINSIDQMETAC